MAIEKPINGGHHIVIGELFGQGKVSTLQGCGLQSLVLIHGFDTGGNGDDFDSRLAFLDLAISAMPPMPGMKMSIAAKSKCMRAISENTASMVSDSNV